MYWFITACVLSKSLAFIFTFMESKRFIVSAVEHFVNSIGVCLFLIKSNTLSLILFPGSWPVNNTADKNESESFSLSACETIPIIIF